MLGNLSDVPFETFGIVRHPLDWMGSWYRYRQRDQLNGLQNSTHGISFDAFLTAYMSEDRPHFARVGDQALDHLFQYEQLDQAVAFFENRLGQQIELPHKNVSPKVDLPVSDENYQAFQSYATDQFTLWQSAHR